MSETGITYQNLFAVLRSLGFREKPSGLKTGRRHIFVHESTDCLLAFGRENTEPITPADMLSTDVHLRARGVIDRPLEALLNALPAQ